ncbi:MAG: butyrate kinase [Ignavibacteria bacterium GWF2_33_9]|nr:MAG: butyrate kinase [Ignavibacteria bacterium GWF2_33_9]
MKILAINPGSTSTKIAVFENDKCLFTETIRHDVDDLLQFRNISEQYEFRKEFIIETLHHFKVKVNDLDAVVGRGGLLKPIPGGVYAVNEAMIADLKVGIQGEHASNLGGIIAHEIASKCERKQIPSFIVDPVVVDELEDVARLSGRPEIPRLSIFHALNQKAVARRFSKDQGKAYTDLNLIVVHLGGGITVGAHRKGRVVDVNNGLDGEGAFSPERTGTLPAGALARLCFSGKFQLSEVRRMITGSGGMVAYLGTNDARKVEDDALKGGDKKAKLVFDGMIYQVCKDIGAFATVLAGDVDAILITGGIAYSKYLIDSISKNVKFIAPVYPYPGEDEMQALAESAYLALIGELEIKEYN